MKLTRWVPHRRTVHIQGITLADAQRMLRIDPGVYFLQTVGGLPSRRKFESTEAMLEAWFAAGPSVSAYVRWSEGNAVLPDALNLWLLEC